MSVVGPRPHMVKHTLDYSKIIDKYMLRHLIKPGITGWAQVNGYRGETRELWQMERRVEYDVWYIEHWNFWLDIKIIFLTVFNASRARRMHSTPTSSVGNQKKYGGLPGLFLIFCRSKTVIDCTS